MTTVQRHELEAWLGADYGDLTEEQVTALLATAQDIQDRYPDPDDEDERQAALIVAYQLMLDEKGIVEEQGRKLLRARIDESAALAALRQAALTLIPAGRETESGFARRAGLDRMAVRGWLGKR